MRYLPYIMMRNTHSLLMGFLAIALLAATPAAAKEATIVEYTSANPLPMFHWLSEGGEQMSLEDYKGAIVLINIWATWCEPCVREMPALSELQHRFASEGLAVLTISQDIGTRKKATRRIQQFFTKLGISNLPIFLDDKQSTFKALKVRGLPTSILIDRTGRKVATIEGYTKWQSGKAHTILKELLMR